MGDHPAQHRVGLGVDRLRVDHPLEEPRRRAVDEALELGRAEGRPSAERLEHGRVAQPRPPVEREPGAAQAPRPAVRLREGGGEVGRPGLDREAGERAQPLACGRRLVDRQRQLRERSPPRGPRDVLGVEDGRHVVPERARLGRRAVVRRGLADERETPRRARARRVEEIAVAADRVGSLEPCAELASSVVVEERRAAPAPRQRPLLEPEHEHMLEPPRARPHADRARATRPGSPASPADTSTRSSAASEVGGRERLAQSFPALELVEQPGGGRDAAEVEPRRVAHRRRVEPVRRAGHRPEQLAHALDRRSGRTQLTQRNERRLAQPLRLGLDRLGRLDGPASQPPLGEVDARAGDARVGRAEEGVQLGAAAGRPREAEQGEQRVAERRRGQAHPAVDRVGDARASRTRSRAARASARATGRRARPAPRRRRPVGAPAPRRRRAGACRACRRLRGRRPHRRSAAASPAAPRTASARARRARAAHTRRSAAPAPACCRLQAPPDPRPSAAATRTRRDRARRAARRRPRPAPQAPRAATTLRR